MRGVEASLRDHPALAVEEGAREVARLAEDRRVGRAHHVRAHLLGDLDELVADHAHRHAVDAARRGGGLGAVAPESRRMPSGEHLQLLAREDERRRVELLDHGGPAKRGSRRKVRAPVDRRLQRADVGEADVAHLPRRRQRPLRQGRRRRTLPGTARGHVGVDQLDRLAREAVAVHLVMQRVERSERAGQRVLVDRAGRERDLALVVLAGVAHAQRALDRRLARRSPLRRALRERRAPSARARAASASMSTASERA